MREPIETLILTNRPIRKESSGYDIRVFNLCQQMPGRLHLFVVPFAPDCSKGAELDRKKVFSSIDEMSPQDWGLPSFYRHFRTRESDFLRLAYPVSYRKLLKRISARIQENRINRIVIFGANLAGLAHDLGVQSTVLDVCDSSVLRMSRDATKSGRDLRGWLQRWRWSRTEGKLTSWFTVVTTIGPIDSAEVARQSHGIHLERLHSIPNGVGAQFLRNTAPAVENRRGVVFWGNLPFPPNRDALRFFFNHIYLPHLKAHQVEVCIIGRDPEPWLLDLSKRDSNVRVLGFVEDLPREIIRYPVMINPMVSGGGMKNKIIEAFGLRLAVVSTSMGIDAFEDVKSGQHLRVADTPTQFSDAVLSLLNDPHERSRMTSNARELLDGHYRWEGIGRKWNRLLDVSVQSTF